MWLTRFPQLRRELDAERIQRAWADDAELLLSFVAGTIQGRAFVTGDLLKLLPALIDDARCFNAFPDYHGLSGFSEATGVVDTFSAIAATNADFSVVGEITGVELMGQAIGVQSMGLSFLLDARRAPPLAKSLGPPTRVTFQVRGLQLWL